MGTGAKCNRWRSSMMQIYSRIIVGLFLIVPLVLASENEQLERNEKLISTFQIVRFPNEVCVGSSSRNGTCYTSQECSNKGGTSAGSCADGFGVCCTFKINTCGSSSSENLTVWVSPTTVESGACGLTINPSEDICSLRLDFTTFVISGPNTWTLAQMNKRLGISVGDQETENFANHGATYTTNCHTDQFYAQGASPSTNPPVVCGTLSASHMYVEADVDRGNRLQF